MTTTHDDGSETISPVESNNTMTKVLDGVDALVEEFVGEDLKADEVLRDAKKQVETEIRPQMKRTPINNQPEKPHQLSM